MTGVSREGIPYKNYRWFHLILAIPFALCEVILSQMLAFLTTEARPLNFSEVPSNAIFVLFHPEWPITITARKTWANFSGCGYIGLHHFKSYAMAGTTFLSGLTAFRYDRRNPQKPLEQLIDYLRSNSAPFAVRTDAGGPYNVVRKSVVRMARETGRPIVCVRQTASRSVKINEHHVPLPLAELSSVASDPIYPSQLDGRSVEEARDFIQAEMDRLLLELCDGDYGRTALPVFLQEVPRVVTNNVT